jgi:hypothetical protein
MPGEPIGMPGTNGIGLLGNQTVDRLRRHMSLDDVAGDLGRVAGG